MVEILKSNAPCTSDTMHMQGYSKKEIKKKKKVTTTQYVRT